MPFFWYKATTVNHLMRFKLTSDSELFIRLVVSLSPNNVTSTVYHDIGTKLHVRGAFNKFPDFFQHKGGTGT